MVESCQNRRVASILDRRDTTKTKKTSRTVETLFRNAIRSNLELTSLADTKASILISVNGFILTVIITASGFQLNDSGMIYPFNAIILTALISITFAILAIRPRFKRHLLNKEDLKDYVSVLYFQDMADLKPDDYVKNVHKVISNKGLTQSHIMKHLHMLGREIQIKYIWLRRAYTSFAIGLLISVILAIFFLHKNQTENRGLNIDNIISSTELLKVD